MTPSPTPPRRVLVLPDDGPVDVPAGPDASASTVAVAVPADDRGSLPVGPLTAMVGSLTAVGWASLACFVC